MAAQAEIVAKLSDSFEKARTSGDLLFFPSTLHTHAENGVEVRSACVLLTLILIRVSVG